MITLDLNTHSHLPLLRWFWYQSRNRAGMAGVVNARGSDALALVA